MSKYVGKAMDLYPASEMLTDMGAIYQRHLSKDDVEGMIVFYSSPAGQTSTGCTTRYCAGVHADRDGQSNGTQPGDDKGNDEGDGGVCAIEAGSDETGNDKSACEVRVRWE